MYCFGQFVAVNFREGIILLLCLDNDKLLAKLRLSCFKQNFTRLQKSLAKNAW